MVNMWSQNKVELWSAYAPNFKELDENDEYTVKEDEFDIVSGRGLTGGRLSGALATITFAVS